MKIDLQFLRNVPLFSELSDGELNCISEKFRERKYRKNEVIFLEEDTGHYMYVVKSGRVKVSRLLPSGKEMILAFHEAGEYFGEMSLIDGGTTPATVTSVASSAVLIMNRQQFTAILENPAINQALLKMLCRRWREAWAQIEVLTFHNADARVRTALYHLCQKRGVKTHAGTMINMKLTHKELADLTGISRETATRVLSQLYSENIVTVRTRQFVISDPEELMDLVAFS